jgi:hippurate hydrolase
VVCEIVLGLRSHLTSGLDPFDPAVLSIGRICAGTTSNVIPETAEIYGTLRAVSERARRRAVDALRRLTEGIAATHEAKAEVTLWPGPPLTVNDHDVAIRVEAIAAELLGNDRVIRMPNPVMGAEDFSYILQQVPGVLAFLGTKPTDLPVDQVAGNHSNRMIIDESAMATGIAFYAEVARRTLATPYPGSRSCLIRWDGREDLPEAGISRR